MWRSPLPEKENAGTDQDDEQHGHDYSFMPRDSFGFDGSRRRNWRGRRNLTELLRRFGVAEWLSVEVHQI